MNRRYPSFNFHVTELWTEDYKRALGYGQNQVKDPNFVPKSFLGCLRDAEFNIFALLDIKLNQLLHLNQNYEFSGDICVGDHIQCQARVSKVFNKKSKLGAFVLLEVTNEFRKQQDPTFLFKSTMTVMVREEA